MSHDVQSAAAKVATVSASFLLTQEWVPLHLDGFLLGDESRAHLLQNGPGLDWRDVRLGMAE